MCDYLVMILTLAVGFVVVARAAATNHGRPWSGADSLYVTCDVRVRTSGGWACGLLRGGGRGARRSPYASFRGLPYAKQPLGHLRFKELEPVEPWSHLLDATADGPACPQHDVFYGRLGRLPLVTSEACITANVHVPLAALTVRRPARNAQPPITTAYGYDSNGYSSPQTSLAESNSTGLPILVFIHGGGFAFGSGDSYMHGPEYLVNEDIIVITINYRLNIFGFLSLNSSEIPGNTGLRDIVTALLWVRDNARAFGGNPADVTLAGQSAGAALAHLLSLSEAARGLFKKVVLMSGTALPSFFTVSPVYAQFVAGKFLTKLAINSTDPQEIHQRLIATPLASLMKVYSRLQDELGVTAFFPVVETSFPGVTTIIDQDPITSLSQGRGRDIPTLVGITSNEGEAFRHTYEKLKFIKRVQDNPLLVISPTITFTMGPAAAADLAKEMEQKYFNGMPTLDEFLKLCGEQAFVYPALKIVQHKQRVGGAPMFLYELAYESQFSPLKEAWQREYSGATHVEDLTYIFRLESVWLPYSERDEEIRELMVTNIVNFVINGCPAPRHIWPPVGVSIQYMLINSPSDHQMTTISGQQWDLIRFMDSIQSPGSTLTSERKSSS